MAEDAIKVPDLSSATPAAADEFHFVDKSDTTSGAAGTSKKGTFQQTNRVYNEAIGSSRTAAAADAGKRLRSNAVVSLTIDGNVFQANDKIDLCQGTADQFTIVQGASMTINFKSGKGLKLDGQHAQATLVFESATEATLTGEIVA